MVVGAGLAQGHLGILGKMAFLMVDFLQVEDTLHKRAVVLVEGAQSHLEGLGDNPQVLKDIHLVVHLFHQRSPPDWMPFQPCSWDQIEWHSHPHFLDQLEVDLNVDRQHRPKDCYLGLLVDIHPLGDSQGNSLQRSYVAHKTFMLCTRLTALGLLSARPREPPRPPPVLRPR